MAYYTQETPESELRIVIDVDEELLEFCNGASDLLEVLQNLYEALNGQQIRLEKAPHPESEAVEDKRDIYEIGIARTLLGLFAEKTTKLRRLATHSSRELGTMLREIERGSETQSGNNQ